MAFLVDGTERASATPGVVQNNPICTPGVAKDADSPATARSQVATSWQPGRRRQPLHLRYDGLGQQADGFHDLGTQREHVGVGGLVAVDKLTQVVARTEHRPLGAQHHYANGVVVFEVAEQVLEFKQRFRR